MKRKTLPQLIELADKVFSDYIRERDNYTCYTCGTTGGKSEIDCGHFIKRDHKRVRYDERNCHAQCKRCNHFLDGNEGVYATCLVRQYGPDILEGLQGMKGLYKISRAELEVVIFDYSRKISDLE